MKNSLGTSPFSLPSSESFSFPMSSGLIHFLAQLSLQTHGQKPLWLPFMSFANCSSFGPWLAHFSLHVHAKIVLNSSTHSPIFLCCF